MKYYFIISALLIFTGCTEAWIDPHKHLWIDFNDPPAEVITGTTMPPGSDYIRVAVASMSAPDGTIHKYSDLFRYIEQKSGRNIILFQRRTYDEVNRLLNNNDIDLAFICSGAYVKGVQDSAFNLFLIPERENQRHYHAYVIVRSDSGFDTFSDLKGSRFVFSDSISNTGMFYPLKRLKDHNTSAKKFFSKVYMSNAHDNSIELVNRGIVDGASVNSLVYDYIQKTEPEKIADLKIIEESIPFGMPPLVVSKQIDPVLEEELFNAFTNMVKDKEGRSILRSLMINRFVTDADTIYNGIRNICNEIGQLDTKYKWLNGDQIK